MSWRGPRPQVEAMTTCCDALRAELEAKERSRILGEHHIKHRAVSFVAARLDTVANPEAWRIKLIRDLRDHLWPDSAAEMRAHEWQIRAIEPPPNSRDEEDAS